VGKKRRNTAWKAFPVEQDLPVDFITHEISSSAPFTNGIAQRVKRARLSHESKLLIHL
jgi:hypothetical protein